MALSGLYFTAGKNEGTEVQGKCYKMQPQFDKDKLCQTDLIVFIGKIIAFLDKRHSYNLDIMYLKAGKIFDA